MSKPDPENDSIDWDFLCQTLVAGESVLFLGPDIATTEDGSSFREAFVQSLDIVRNPLVASYYTEDELFLFNDNIAKSKVYYQMKEFYKRTYQEDLYALISQLPLKLIINASPDHFLAEKLGAENHHFSFFHKNDPTEHIPTGSLAKPLIYNLVGSLEAEESLLLTHDDLYDFLQAMLSGKGLPESLRNHIFSARSLIFLGFRFDKWYVQLLLRLLKVQDMRSRFARYATEQKYNADTLSICLDQFKIEFVNQNVDAFLQKLHGACVKADALVQRTASSHTSSKEKIRLLVAENKLEDALDLLNQIAHEKKDDELSKEVTLLEGRLYRLEKRIRKGLISPQDAEVERNKIIDAILEIADELS